MDHAPRSGRAPRALVLAALAAVLLAMLAVTTPASGKNFDAHTRKQLSKSLSDSWAKSWSPGVIASVQVGKRSWTKSLGSMDRTAGPKPDLDLHTRVGSVTKTMVGTLILQLADDGALSLDDTLDTWFPAIPDASNITVRDLGSMASGIPSYTADPNVDARYFADPAAPWAPDELIDAGAALPRLFPPGMGFNYSDTNFVILGRIVEMETGQPLGAVLQANIFDPLGMDESSYPATAALPKPYWRSFTAQGSQGGNLLETTDWSPTFAAGAGGVVSALADLRVWAKSLGTGSLISPAAQRERLIPNTASEGPGRAYLFALGNDNGWLAHDGDIPGYNTQVAYLPAEKATIVVMANSDVGDPSGRTPAPIVYRALGRVVAPKNVPPFPPR